MSTRCIYSIKFKYCDNNIHVVNKFGIWKKEKMLILIHLPLVLSPPPILRLWITLFAVAEGWLLLDIGWFCLVLVNSHLFTLPCGAGSIVPREGFNLSVIILASLLVCPMLGCRHSLLRLSNNITFFSSGIHIFEHSYLCTLASRGTLLSVLALTIKCKSCSTGASSICISLMKLIALLFP